MDGLIALALAKKYANNKVAEIPTGFHIKEAVSTYDDLPTSGNNPGDVRETLDEERFYFWDGAEWEPMHSVVEVDEELDEHSPNPVQNKKIVEALSDKQDKDPDAEVGAVAIFNNNGSTVGSGVVMEEAEGMDILVSTDTTVATDEQIPTALWVKTNAQDKTLTVGSSTTTFVDSQEVPQLNKAQVTAAYNAFIAGTTVIVIDTLHDYYYQVNQAMHKVVDGHEELTISINVHNASFVDYIYNNETDAVTVTSTFKAVSQSDMDYWDAKADKATLTKTTSNDVVLTNGDTTVITQQIGEITISFDLPDDPEEDFVSSVIFKPYDLFIFHCDEPAGYALTWGTDVPSFESGSVYELVFKILGITGPGGNVLISGKWSKVA